MRHFPGRIGWAHVQLPLVDGAVESIPAAVQLVAGTTGYHTLALAVPAAPLEGHVEITREGVIAKIAKLFGAQDIQLGEEAFDRTFLVKGTSERTVRAVLSALVRQEMLQMDAVRVAYDDGSAHKHGPMALLEVPRIVTGAAELDRVLAAVVEMARAKVQETAYR